MRESGVVTVKSAVGQLAALLLGHIALVVLLWNDIITKFANTIFFKLYLSAQSHRKTQKPSLTKEMILKYVFY